MSILAKGFFWNFFRTILERGLLFVQQILLAKFLIPEIFGTFSSIASIMALSSLISLFGHSEFLSYRYKTINIWLPHFNLGTTIISALSFFLYCFFSIGINNFNDHDLFFVVLYGLIIPLNSFKSVDMVKLQIEGEYGFIAQVKVVQTLILCSLSIYLAYIGYSLEAIIISSIVGAFYEFISFRFKTRLGFKISKTNKKALLMFFKSSKLIGFNLGWRFINFIDFILIVHLIGKDKGGLYFMAFGISVQTLNLFISYLPSLLFSSNVRDNLNTLQVKIRIQKLILILLLFTTPLLIGLSVYSNELVLFFFNDTWKGTSEIIKVLSIAMIFRVISSQWYLVLMSQKKYSLLSKISLVFALLFFIIFYSGTSYFGLEGSAYSILIFYILTLLLVFKTFFLNNKYLKESLKVLVLSYLSVIIPKNVINFDNQSINFGVGVLLSIIMYVFFVYKLNRTTINLIKDHLKSLKGA